METGTKVVFGLVALFVVFATFAAAASLVATSPVATSGPVKIATAYPAVNSSANCSATHAKIRVVPSLQSGPAGTTLVYRTYVTNTAPAVCKHKNFVLNHGVPYGYPTPWEGRFEDAYLVIPTGETRSTLYYLTSSPDAKNGDYEFVNMVRVESSFDNVWTTGIYRVVDAPSPVKPKLVSRSA